MRLAAEERYSFKAAAAALNVSEQSLRAWHAAGVDRFLGAAANRRLQAVDDGAARPDRRRLNLCRRRISWSSPKASRQAREACKPWRLREDATGEPDKETYPLDAPTIHWALSNDRTKLARSGSSDVTVTDLTENKVVLSKEYPTNEVNLVHAIRFSPDGNFLAMALRNDGRHRPKSDVGKVQVWNVARDKEVFSKWPLITSVADVAFSPDGKRFAAGSYKLEVWESSGFSSLFSLPAPEAPSRHFPIQSLAFDFANTWLATGGGDGFIRLWNAANGKLIATLDEALGPVNAVCLDGTKLAAVGSDKSVLVWSLSPQQP